MLTVELKSPPSINRYWRARRSSRTPYISAEGLAYRASVVATIGRVAPIAGPVSVQVAWFPPDKRRRDTDNIVKVLFDALTAAGVWVDDNQVSAFRVERYTPEPPGRVLVAIRRHRPSSIAKAIERLVDESKGRKRTDAPPRVSRNANRRA